MTAPSPMGCAQVQGEAAELALGVATGPDRAEALSHLGTCGDCRRVIDDLSHVVDDLLLLTPLTEPRIGFEGRILEGMRSDSHPPPIPVPLPPVPRRAKPSRLAPVVASLTVAVLMAAAGVAAGMALTGGGPDTRSGQSVSAGGQATCRVVVHGESPAWLFVDLEAPALWAADLGVEVVTASKTSRIGQLTLDGGQGTFAARLDVGAADVTSIRVVDAQGVVRYEVLVS